MLELAPFKKELLRRRERGHCWVVIKVDEGIVDREEAVIGWHPRQRTFAVWECLKGTIHWVKLTQSLTTSTALSYCSKRTLSMWVSKVKYNILQDEASWDSELEEGACFVHHSHWLSGAIALVMGGWSWAFQSPRIKKDLLDGEGVVAISLILCAILKISCWESRG